MCILVSMMEQPRRNSKSYGLESYIELDLEEMVQVVHICDLTKVYSRSRVRRGSSATALDRVSLTIGRGEIFALLGPNGAGKTTLMKILSTLILPTSGTATVDGWDILRQPDKVRSSLGFSPGGERSFYFRLTGRQNLEFFGALQGLTPPYLNRRISQVLNRVGFEEEADKRFMKYSSGMRRKLGIARALLTDPPILLLDEPTASVDPTSARHIREHIMELKAKGRTILLTTHNMHEAESISDRIGILNKVRLIAADTPASLKGVLYQSRLQLTIGNWGRDPAKFIGELRSIDGVSAVIDRNPLLEVIMTQKESAVNEIMRSIVEYAVEVESIATIEPSLEDIFLMFVGGEMRHDEPCIKHTSS